MTLHKKITSRELLAVSMLAMSGGALAAQVPPGTQLAEKQELVRNNGSEPAHSIRIKSRATLNSTSLAISLKGWSA
jgi:ABC-type oligopeptide transport system substrate-binding subunit